MSKAGELHRQAKYRARIKAGSPLPKQVTPAMVESMGKTDSKPASSPRKNPPHGAKS